ncbi:MAG: UDP-glucose 4-epimerase [Myxococcaceae bacterium]|nr:UDP-glucose 4-epimerase [Myxococcaceae bacterium]
MSDTATHRTSRVDVSAEAEKVIEALRSQHGPLMFHQSGGCCDGSSPMCYPRGEFRIGARDVYLGEIAGCPFFMGAEQFEAWQHTHLTVDVVPGRGGGFSLESPLGVRFLVRSRLFEERELASLTPARVGEQPSR